jgi:hypothetical protein
MVERSRTKLLEVTIAGLSDQSWEWRVVAGDEILIIGFEATRLEARVAGNAALFLTLDSSGWNR